MTELIPLLLERAFDRAGYAAVWRERRFPESRGDGFVVGFRPELLPVLLGPVVDGLQDELADRHDVRMRMSIAVGPLTDTGIERHGDGSGAAMVETHRLLDCDPVRRLLEDSDPAVTFLAVVISGRVYEDVVVSGYTTKGPSEFLAVPVRVKSYQGTAYLHVPRLSGRLLERGLGRAHTGAHGMTEPVAAQADPEPEGSVVNTISGRVGGPVLQSRDIQVGSGTFVVGNTLDDRRA
ncbi:hypothetical protein [Actinophytocola sp.]|uniref:hypothetical protein n=1 Tax=Actinophytocola sp. TaxID=1872138 RepID=UPI002DDC9650|nr:hypothetical protein [Actinophytocola sp.]